MESKRRVSARRNRAIGKHRFRRDAREKFSINQYARTRVRLPSPPSSHRSIARDVGAIAPKKEAEINYLWRRRTPDRSAADDRSIDRSSVRLVESNPVLPPRVSRFAFFRLSFSRVAARAKTLMKLDEGDYVRRVSRKPLWIFVAEKEFIPTPRNVAAVSRRFATD